jgi:RNA polymerase sigma-70 factor (ECF subfamily)
VTDAGGFQARLAAARDGDPIAWSELYHDIAPLVIGYLRAQRLEDAEDVAGEVLLEIVRDLHRFEGDADNLRSWVLAIAHHRLLDARRRAARRPRPAEHAEVHPAPVAGDDPESETLSALGFGRLEGLLSSLTEDQRNVLLLRVIGDLSIAEVAAITGKRPGAVKQLQRRAAAVMRRQLEAAQRGTPPSPDAAGIPASVPAPARSPRRL